MTSRGTDRKRIGIVTRADVTRADAGPPSHHPRVGISYFPLTASSSCKTQTQVNVDMAQLSASAESRLGFGFSTILSFDVTCHQTRGADGRAVARQTRAAKTAVYVRSDT